MPPGPAVASPPRSAGTRPGPAVRSWCHLVADSFALTPRDGASAGRAAHKAVRGSFPVGPTRHPAVLRPRLEPHPHPKIHITPAVALRRARPAGVSP